MSLAAADLERPTEQLKREEGHFANLIPLLLNAGADVNARDKQVRIMPVCCCGGWGGGSVSRSR